MIDSGSGESHINTTLLSIDVPPLAPANIKRYERRVGCIIEEVAKESCVDAIQLEKKLTLLNEPEQVKNHLENDLEEKIVHVKASYDSGWQKRGNGRSYNSLSGHGTAIGYYSGKVISVAVRSKDCRFCRIGHPKCDHDCRRNYEDSAKSMEANMAVELFNNNPLFKEEHIQIRTLIGDEDSCTIAAVRRAVNYDVEKWSDYNHIKKSFTSSLYTLKLSPTLINYFSKTFSIAIKKNRGDATEIENTLLAIVPHAYGEHSNCGDWCTAKENEHYIYRYLPHGKSLTDSNVKVKVGELVARYAANSAKIAPCGSTEANESLNQTIATRNPKAIHYSGSESLSFRVHAAVCQKNIGCRYSNTVFSKMGYFESETSLRIKKQKDALRERRSNTIRTVANKRRRQELKKNKSIKKFCFQ